MAPAVREARLGRRKEARPAVWKLRRRVVAAPVAVPSCSAEQFPRLARKADGEFPEPEPAFAPELPVPAVAGIPQTVFVRAALNRAVESQESYRTAAVVVTTPGEKTAKGRAWQGSPDLCPPHSCSIEKAELHPQR